MTASLQNIRSRATEQRDEPAPFHLITSSAWTMQRQRIAAARMRADRR
jgi:hypothetical protein